MTLALSRMLFVPSCHPSPDSNCLVTCEIIAYVSYFALFLTAQLFLHYDLYKTYYTHAMLLILPAYLCNRYSRIASTFIALYRAPQPGDPPVSFPSKKECSLCCCSCRQCCSCRPWQISSRHKLFRVGLVLWVMLRLSFFAGNVSLLLKVSRAALRGRPIGIKRSGRRARRSPSR